MGKKNRTQKWISGIVVGIVFGPLFIGWQILKLWGVREVAIILHVPETPVCIGFFCIFVGITYWQRKKLYKLATKIFFKIHRFLWRKRLGWVYSMYSLS